MFDFKDFIYDKKNQGALTFHDNQLRKLLGEANKWIETENVVVLNIETVVLPNVNALGEEGPEDIHLIQGSDGFTEWDQFIRVWYKKEK